MNNTLPVFKNEVNCDKKVVAEIIHDTMQKLYSGKLSQSFKDGFIKMSISDINRSLSHINSRSSGIQKILLNMIITESYKAESISPSSSIIFASSLASYLQTKTIEGINRHDLISDIKQLSLLTRDACIKDLYECFESIQVHKRIVDIVSGAVQLVGIDGHIYVDHGHSKNTYVESIPGFKFKITVPEKYLHNVKKITRFNPRVAIIDGIVEKYSEINTIIQQLADKGESGILICRGYSDEVINTLSVNFKNKKIDVLPLSIAYDESGVNMLKDIAIVCNTDVRSSFKGELISTMNIDDMVNVDKLMYENGSIIIENDISHHRVMLHRNRLKDIEKEANNEYKKNMLLSRIKSLSSNCAYVKVSEASKESKGITLDKISMTINCYRDVAFYGIIDISSIDLQKIKTKHIINIISDLRNIGITKVGSRSFFLGINKAHSLFKNLNNCETIVMID